MPPDLDWQLRLAAFARLEELKRARGGVLTADDLDGGFSFDGETIKFWSSRRGIWRPKQLSTSGAALSITTAPFKPGKKPPYDDQIASDADWFIYRYEGDDPKTWTNVAVCAAMEQHRPLIYFYGLAAGVYDAIFPCYVVADHPDQLAFEVAADVEGVRLDPATAGIDADAARRRYGTATVKTRLHQRGRPEVPNGLSLCKIHHGAYDIEILGVDPDYKVHIRSDVLKEEDGPMLLHGLQELHGSRIILPKAEGLRPNREYLAERFGRFRAA